jgi:hypothetical protein
MKRAVALLLSALLGLSAGQNDDIARFVSLFSKHFSVSDHKALLKTRAVHFPLKLKGTLDDSPEIAVNEKTFALVLAKISRQPSGLNSANMAETEAEHLVAVLRAGKLPEDAGESTRRTGNLVFKKNGNAWQLVQVYVSDDLIESLQNKGK